MATARFRVTALVMAMVMDYCYYGLLLYATTADLVAVWLNVALVHLGCFAIVEPEVVAGLEVEGDGGVRDTL